ncbi:MAG: tRNA preQ1(34) S-adenosylmethionine ribosyltransferase-isomerase QueA [Oligoflexia bacterium]|nr:tRNA preQ1(34) S-adenosylmethionine ribosyltransferase-isomerase QueA [Oligoflexia bacterium]
MLDQNISLTQNEDQLLSSYDYDLPQELIAIRPAPQRAHSRLLTFISEDKSITHNHFYNLPSLLPPQTLLVLNRSKVVPARLIGKRLHSSGSGTVEILLTSMIANDRGDFKVLIRSNAKKHLGDSYLLANGNIVATITAIETDGTFSVHLSGLSGLNGQQKIIDLLKAHATLPIPPYIRNGVADKHDYLDYQTTFACEEGSVAAPTAGLHFTPEIFQELYSSAAGIDTAFVTLHVGPGTFAPVREEGDIRKHQMHQEDFFIDQENLLKIQTALEEKRPIITVGTTSLRVLASITAANINSLTPNHLYSTNIFLYPGKEIQFPLAGLITNFHWPKSTLLMLVSALIGRSQTLCLYQEAIRNRYRFFSYGDAMLILQKKN